MASTRRLLTKDGRVYYEINVSRGRGKSRLIHRWYVPDGWSRRAIERELAAVAAEWTGIPVRRLTEDEGARLLELEEITEAEPGDHRLYVGYNAGPSRAKRTSSTAYSREVMAVYQEYIEEMEETE